MRDVCVAVCLCFLFHLDLLMCLYLGWATRHKHIQTRDISSQQTQTWADDCFAKHNLTAESPLSEQTYFSNDDLSIGVAHMHTVRIACWHNCISVYAHNEPCVDCWHNCGLVCAHGCISHTNMDWWLRHKKPWLQNLRSANTDADRELMPYN